MLQRWETTQGTKYREGTKGETTQGTKHREGTKPPCQCHSLRRLPKTTQGTKYRESTEKSCVKSVNDLMHRYSTTSAHETTGPWALDEKRQFCPIRLQRTAAFLFALDGFEQGFEVAFTEGLRAFALNDFEKHGRPGLDRLGEDLQQIAFVVAIDQDAEFA